MKEKILITGCAGFIGFHLSKRFCDNGYDVIGIDNINDCYDIKLKNSRLSILNTNNNFSFKKNDIIDKKALNKIFKKNKIKFIFHLAAQAGVRGSIDNPKHYIDSNIIGFLNILEECKKYKINLFYASSSSVYGDSNNLIFNENQKTDTQVSIYGVTKKTNELMAHVYYSLFKINSIGFRFFTVYGPWGRPDMAYFKFTNNILNNKNINVYNNGKHNRSFTYIDDIIESIVLVYKKYKTDNKFYDILNIGSNQSVSVLELIKEIELKIGKKATINYLEKQKGDVNNTSSDYTKLNDLINFVPQIKLNKGISCFVDWYINFYNKKI